jgi:hypothetical protein
MVYFNGYFLEGLGIENLGIFYDHCTYFGVLWFILWPLHIFWGYLVYFTSFSMLYQEKSGNPGSNLKISSEKGKNRGAPYVMMEVKAKWWKGCQIFLGTTYQNRK